MLRHMNFHEKIIEIINIISGKIGAKYLINIKIKFYSILFILYLDFNNDYLIYILKKLF